MTDEQEGLSLSPETIDRFEEFRMETRNEHVPEMSQDAYLNSLLDTVVAVREGYYSEGSGDGGDEGTDR